MLTHTLALGMPGMTEWIIIGALGLLIFGKRLPEVGKGVGQAIVNFKRGLREAETEIEQVDQDVDRRPKLTQQQTPTGYKYDPHTGKPIEGTAEAESSTSSTGTH